MQDVPATATATATATVCPLYHQAAELIGRRWTGAIVRALADGAVRFGDVVVAVPGISDRMLSERLKELEAEGLVTRSVYPEHPVRIEYRLTEKGADLGAVMDAIAGWAHRWLTAGDAAEATGSRPIAEAAPIR